MANPADVRTRSTAAGRRAADGAADQAGWLSRGGRSGGVRRAAGPARRTRAPRLRRRIRGRTAAIGLLLIGLVLAYAYPTRVYLAQQAEIDQLRAAQAQQRGRIEDLKAQLARWNDPNYIITQARVRLQLVRKGELIFVVQADDPAPADPAATSGGSWLDQVWSNVQGADHPDGS
jgi:cell division protein FtsB